MSQRMKKITTCLSCGSGKIKKVKKNWKGKFQGQKYTVPSLEYHECPSCGEKVYDREAMRKIESHSPVFANNQQD